MKKTVCVILAAGKGTRMISDIPKPLQKLHSRSMLGFLTESVEKAGIKDMLLVLGHKAEQVSKVFSTCDYVVQEKQRGSGDAVASVKDKLKGFDGNIVILYSDTPLLRVHTIKKLLKTHNKTNAGITVLTGVVEDSFGYGRIIREVNHIVNIVEEKDATEKQKHIKEINIGAYVFNSKVLFDNLSEIKLNKKKKEYYLTDIIKICSDKNIKVSSVITDDMTDGLGINSKVELAQAEEIIRKKVLFDLMEKGVIIVDPNNTYVDKSAKIGKDTTIQPNSIIERDVKIGKGCQIGPFARIRENSVLKDKAEVGTFAEIVRTTIGQNTKVKHQTYLGDTIVGKNVNIGAGVITANYDGKNKHKTYIEDNAFIGIGTRLVAPVKIGKGASTGAGTVVLKNRNVPANSVAVGSPARIL